MAARFECRFKSAADDADDDSPKEVDDASPKDEVDDDELRVFATGATAGKPEDDESKAAGGWLS